MMEFTWNVNEKNASLLDTHTLLSRGITSSILPGIYSIAVALVFTAVPHIFTHGGHKVGARGKDEVLPQSDGSIVSGSTVADILLWYNWLYVGVLILWLVQLVLLMTERDHPLNLSRVFVVCPGQVGASLWGINEYTCNNYTKI